MQALFPAKPFQPPIRPSLDELRAITGAAPPKRRDFLPFSLVDQGIPKGAITHFAGRPGSGKREALLRFLAENPEPRVAWVEERQGVYPPALCGQGPELDRFFFVEAGEEFQWASLQVLRSGLFGILVLNQGQREEAFLKRLQIGAEQTGTSILLLDELPLEGAWAVTLEVGFQRSQRLHSPDPIRARVARTRGMAWKMAANS
jgi:hypothetical protein